MDADTLVALKASISKWEKNAEAEDPDQMRTGISDCPLCHLFYDENCDGCPVMAKTGKSFCKGSPYKAARDARFNWRDHSDSTPLRDLARAAARTEAAFLKSLLPTGTAS